MKKFLITVLSILCIMCFSFSFVACSDNEKNTDDKDQILAVYNTYVAYAEENGQTPLSYEEWLASVKGEKGETGANGVDGVSPKLQINTTTNMWEISYDDGKTWTSLNVKATGSNGTNGTNGTNGIDGVSPKLQINATTNMWEVSYDNGKTWISLNVKATGSDGTNGTNGTNGVDGVSPKLQINTTTNMWEVSYDNGKTWISLNVKATGSNGANGTNGVNGLSAYELFKKYNPTYNKTENEWLEDLVAGQLHVINITIDGDGGSVDDTNIITKSNSYISVDIPTKNGYDFVGWSLNGSIIDINTYVFFTDCTLKAIWKDAEEVTINFNADSGIVSPVKTIIEFGKNYSLPTPSKEYQTFAGWYYLDTLIPQTGVWEYTHEEITLTAKWNKTNIYANLSVDAEYGAVDKSKVTLAIGDYYTLPVPSSLKDGESFQGWYNGNEKVTDAQGKSFEKCTWNSTVTLTAAYYTEISTIYEFMDLAGKDLVGKYIITQDLDFKGLGVNCINSLTGIFDGGGHTLKNFVLATDFGLINKLNAESTVCNVAFQNGSYSQGYMGRDGVGLINEMEESSVVDNIYMLNCFNNVNMDSVLVKHITYRYNTTGNITKISNIHIQNTGNKAKSYVLFSVLSYVEAIELNNIYIDGAPNLFEGSAGVIKQGTGSAFRLNIKGLYLNTDVSYGIAGNGISGKITVSQSEIHSRTKTAWSGVSLLEDCILTGTTQEWGAKESVRCIDAGSEIGSYDLGKISSSIVLYPDANGVFTYYSASGTMATFNDVSLIDKDLFISMLGFDSNVWNLDNIDIENGKYPRIRS